MRNLPILLYCIVFFFSSLKFMKHCIASNQEQIPISITHNYFVYDNAEMKKKKIFLDEFWYGKIECLLYLYA